MLDLLSFQILIKHLNQKLIIITIGLSAKTKPRNQLKPESLLFPENCLTLWNSRLIHANEAIMMSKTEFESKISETHYSQSNPALVNRVTAYITFQPKSLRPDCILEKKE